jgi:response regulator of citrate/malate metabolism
MSKIKCIIIEDEPLAAKVLSDYILQTPFLELQATFKDAILATDWLRYNVTDLIFLDIHLPKLKGMAFLKHLLIPRCHCHNGLSSICSRRFRSECNRLPAKAF